MIRQLRQPHGTHGSFSLSRPSTIMSLPSPPFDRRSNAPTRTCHLLPWYDTILQVVGGNWKLPLMGIVSPYVWEDRVQVSWMNLIPISGVPAFARRVYLWIHWQGGLDWRRAADTHRTALRRCPCGLVRVCRFASSFRSDVLEG
jgi:hypothetical protein